MIALPPPRFQKTSAALSSEERNIDSNDFWSAGESASPFISRSSAMNSLTTDAIAIPLPLPLVIRRPVERSRTTVVRSAPFEAAPAVACLMRVSRPSNVATGSSGEASGSGAMLPCGATTISFGASGSTGGRAVHPGFATGHGQHGRGQPRPASTGAVAYVSSKKLLCRERASLTAARPHGRA